MNYASGDLLVVLYNPLFASDAEAGHGEASFNRWKDSMFISITPKTALCPQKFSQRVHDNMMQSIANMIPKISSSGRVGLGFGHRYVYPQISSRICGSEFISCTMYIDNPRFLVYSFLSRCVHIFHFTPLQWLFQV
jgi:hypothetical protein